MLYLKPQSPIKNKENYIYPLTTYDQVILADGSRWTGSISEDEKAAIIREVVNALATPVYGRVDENNNIILGGNLPEGSYMIKYESANGNTTIIGTLTVSTDEEEDVTVTNVIPLSVDVNGNLYNGGTGYKTGYRYSQSSGGDVAGSAYSTTGYIKVNQGDVLYFKNVGMNVNTTDNNTCAMYYFTELKATADGQNNGANLTNYNSAQWDANGQITQLTSDLNGYVKFNTAYLGDDSIITINEPIPEGEVTTNLVVLNWRIGVEINANSYGQMNATNGIQNATSEIIAIEDGITYTYKDGNNISGNRSVRLNYYGSDGAYLNRSDDLVGMNNTALTFIEGAKYFRVQINDYATSTAENFISNVAIEASAPLKTYSVPFTLTTGIVLDKTTGAESTTTSNYMCSDFIEVDTTNSYTLFAAINSWTAANVNCFNENKTQIGYLNGVIASVSADVPTQFTSGVLAIPDGTKYIRLRCSHGGGNETQLTQWVNNYSLLCTEP